MQALTRCPTGICRIHARLSHKHHLCGAFQYSPSATSPNLKTHLDDLCKLHGLGHRSTRLRILLCKTHSNNSLESEIYCPLFQIKPQYNALLIQKQISLQVHPDQIWGGVGGVDSVRQSAPRFLDDFAAGDAPDSNRLPT